MLAAFVGQVCGLVLALLHSQCCVKMCYIEGLMCYIEGLMCYIEGLMCYIEGLMCYIEGLMCYIEGLMCYIEGLMCYIEGLMCYIEAELGAENSPTVVLKDTSLMSIGPEP